MDHQTKLAEIKEHINSLIDFRAKTELNALYRNCIAILEEISKEEVECRRRKKLTQKYTELETQLTERIEHIDQWVTYAKLLY
jgi:hypothetical protein